MSIGLAVAVALSTAGIAFWLALSASRRRARERLAASRAEAAALTRSARIEATAIRRAAETAARSQGLDLRDAADEEEREAVEELARRGERTGERDAELRAALAALDAREAALDKRQRAVKSARDRAESLRRDAADKRARAQAQLEEKVGDSADAIATKLVQRWVDDARAEAAHTLRAIEQNTQDPRYDREAKRIMDIAMSRYQNHFLTERNISNIRVGDGVCELLVADSGVVVEALQEVANVQLHVSEAGDAVRLEGLDGVGREVARRALSRLSKRASARSDAHSDPQAWAQKIRTNLEREIQALGKKAFSVLAIPRSHPEIVGLVGALNYRTSYTQNQWLHAVEASFMAGMMASEMGLDIKLARRATLMHDIGKALTHEIEGSHAVIGADIARRLGEDEIVANAIGAHHADEPPSSVYAYLVAAADAMSGARPGARREMVEGFSNRVDELERIGAGYRGVDRAHAVHGGRELRVYVREQQVDDRGVIALSSEIAEQVSEEMTFPGQIKVTVIRSLEAVAVAN